MPLSAAPTTIQRRLRTWLVAVGGWIVLAEIIQLGLHGQEAAEPQRGNSSPVQALVGEWKGVGQPRRGSAQDAWPERCRWTWNFQSAPPQLVLESPDGKYLRRATLQSAGKGGWLLTWKRDGQPDIRFEGKLSPAANTAGKEFPPEGAPPTLTLTTSSTTSDVPARITLRFAAGGDRLLVLYEQLTNGDRFQRLAEVGFTRQGSRFGKDATGVECIVTGGAGTIPVTYQGQTYYVCCSGCRDYFQEHAAEVLAEYRARKAQKAK